MFIFFLFLTPFIKLTLLLTYGLVVSRWRIVSIGFYHHFSSTFHIFDSLSSFKSTQINHKFFFIFFFDKITNKWTKSWLMKLKVNRWLCEGVKLMCFFILSFLQYGQRVPTAASPSNTNSSSSSNTGSQSGTLSTSLSNTNTNNTMGPSTTPQQTEQLSKTNLYIRGLQQGTTDKDLHNMCSQWVLYLRHLPFQPFTLNSVVHGSSFVLKFLPLHNPLNDCTTTSRQ